MANNVSATLTASPAVVAPGGSVSIKVENGFGISGSYTLKYYINGTGTGYSIASGSEVVSTKTFSWSVPTASSNALVRAVMASGSVSVTIKWSQYDDYSGISSSGSVSVTVKRAEAPSFITDAAEYSIGDTVTFTINPSSSLYRHKITYTCGSQSGTAVAEFSGTGSGQQRKTFVIPSGLALGNTMVFLLTTEYAGTSIGSSTASVRLASPMWVPDAEPDVGDTVQIRTNLVGTWTFSWSYGEETQTIASGVTAGSYDWTIPAAVAMAFPTYTSATITVKGVYTPASGSAETYTQDIHVSVPNVSAARPVVSAELVPAGEAMTINPSVYYQNIRGVKATVTASSDYAEITGFALTLEGVTTVGTGVSANVMQSAAFQQSGQVPVTITVTDSRGYQTQAEYTLEVVPYTRPAIVPHSGDIRAVAERSGDERKDLLVRFGAVCSVVDGAEGSVKLRVDSGAWQTVASTTSGAWEGAQTKVNALPDISAVYKVYLSVEDALGVSNVLLVEVPSTGTPLHLAEGGRRIGFGGFVNNATPDRTHHFWRSVFHAGADVSDNLCGTLSGGAGSWQWSQSRDVIDSFNLFLCEVLTGDTTVGCFLACRSGNVLMGYYGTETLRMEKDTAWGLTSCTVTGGTSIRVIALL